MVTDSTPINAAIFETGKVLNSVLRPQRCFNVQTTFLSISAPVSHFCLDLLLLHAYCTDTHTTTTTNAKIYLCWGQILISLADSLLALHPNGLVFHRLYI